MNITRIYSIVFGSFLYAGMVHAAQAPSDKEKNDRPDVVVVAASKQSPYSASSLNVASTVVDPSQLEDARVTTIQELTRVLPGLTIEKSGSLLYPIISLRGISSAQDFYKPAISIYVDGVPLLATDMLQTLDNVQSVEMLKGPQGTLYGQNAEGGIINIVTQKPDNAPRGFIEGGYGSRQSYHGKVHISGSLEKGLLFASLTLLQQDDKGDLINPATGSDDLGGAKEKLGNLKLRLAPDDQPWETNLSISNHCTKATQDTYIAYDDVDNKTLNLSSGSPDPYLKRCSHSQSLAGTYTTQNWALNMVTAFQQQNFQRTFPNGSIIATMPEDWLQNIQEIRAATRGKNRTIDAVFGLYRQYTKQKINLSYDLFSGSNFQTTDSHTTMQSLAAYSDLTWHVNEQFNLGGGLRFSHDRAKTNYDISQLGTNYNAHNKLSDNKVLGQISAGYQANQDWYLYSKIAQGYKPAGFNIIPPATSSATPYEAENSINYEIGSRYQSGNVQFAGAVFHSQTRDMQLYSGPISAQTLSNAGTANTVGIELSSSWQFIPGWSWDINGTAVHAKFADDSVTFADKDVPFVPHFSGGIALSGLVDSSYGLLTPRVAVNVVGPHYFDGDNQLRQSTYALTDLHLGWQATEQLNVSVYANNVFDRHYRTYAYSTSAAQVNIGRTVGLDVHLDFF
jgi:pesticin/yersiniabactin receptor